ncbi:MAG: hypothetical protein WD965_07170 [Actinomycetota bacterium]
MAGGGIARVRWDIVSIDFENSEVNEGGIASALAADSSKITLTGNGTFVPKEPKEVTGGGTFTLFDPAGNEVESGSYTVTKLLFWRVAPGESPPLADNIGNPAKRGAGLVFLKVKYSNGSSGVLVVSCHLVGTPDSVFEGVTASMGFIDYFDSEAPPAPPGDANRTLFHITPG